MANGDGEETPGPLSCYSFGECPEELRFPKV